MAVQEANYYSGNPQAARRRERAQRRLELIGFEKQSIIRDALNRGCFPPSDIAAETLATERVDQSLLSERLSAIEDKLGI